MNTGHQEGCSPPLRAGQLTVFALCLCLLAAPTLAQQSFDEWLEQDQAEFAAYNAEVTAAYEKFLKEEAEAFAAFMKEAGETWGTGNVWVPAQKEWVQYRDDLEERSNVDFENGHAEIEVIVPPDAGEDEVADAVADAVETLVLSGSIDPIEMMRRRLFPQSRKRPPARQPTTAKPPKASPDTEPFIYTVQKGDSLWRVSRNFKVSREAIAKANGISPDDWLKIGQKLRIPGKASVTSTVSAPKRAAPKTKPRDLRLADEGKKPLLDRQVRTADGKPVTRENARQFAEQVAAGKTTEKRDVRGDDGKSRRVVTARFPLVPEHVRVRADRFRPLVTKYAAEYEIPSPLIYAIMESESSFNPRARSGVPAYGLMQLVPRSGARDAYRYVYKKDKLVSGTYLYDPRNNIELGTAYLRILDKRYFKRIDNDLNRQLCSIAAYNTGAGNVCKAFGAGTSLSRAAPIINSMTPVQVYVKLRKDLPYAETRNYIKKVTDRMPQYEAWQ